MERLQKVIANSGYCSRRKAEELISKGCVMVNGITVYEQGIKVDGNDTITVNGNSINREEKEYILLYKPRGVVTTTKDDKGRKTVVDLLHTNKRLYPVGRLDYDTSGVLLLTNDGDLANKLMHPKNHVDKLYIAKVEGIVTSSVAKKIASGVYIDGKRTSRAKIKIKKINKKDNTTIVEIVIHEGRNHQVKKMFEAFGFKVIKLKREMYSFLDLTGLRSGEYRNLSIKEVKCLYNEVNNKSL